MTLFLIKEQGVSYQHSHPDGGLCSAGVEGDVRLVAQQLVDLLHHVRLTDVLGRQDRRVGSQLLREVKSGLQHVWKQVNNEVTLGLVVQVSSRRCSFLQKLDQMK